MESMLDFTLNQSESEQQFEEDVFRGFSHEEFEKEGKNNLQPLNMCKNDFFSKGLHSTLFQIHLLGVQNLRYISKGQHQ